MKLLACGPTGRKWQSQNVDPGLCTKLVLFEPDLLSGSELKTWAAPPRAASRCPPPARLGRCASHTCWFFLEMPGRRTYEKAIVE